MNQKLFFFDVDGTLVDDESKEIPQSAVTAIKSLREAGHLVYLNSGRTRCLLEYEMEKCGISCAVCGCGTEIIADGKVLLERRISRERGIELRKLLMELKLDAVLEAQEAIYFSERPFENEALMEGLLNFVSNYAAAKVNALQDTSFLFDKFCVQTKPGGEKDPRIEILLQATPDFEGIARGRGFYEFVPKGYTKGAAVNLLMKRFSIAPEDCYVFGDSVNDLTMFQSNAAHRIAMGEHDKELEAYASDIADTVQADGIAKALHALNVLER